MQYILAVFIFRLNTVVLEDFVMSIYYIDNLNGDNAADALSVENARKDYTDIMLEPGDTVLFKRGSFYRN